MNQLIPFLVQVKGKIGLDLFLGTQIGEILGIFKILIWDKSLKFGTRMTRVCFGKTRMVTDSLKRRLMVADFLEHRLEKFEKSLRGFKFQVSGFLGTQIGGILII